MAKPVLFIWQKEEQVMTQAEKFGLKPISNWGRWGKDDQLGTANFITPAVIAKAAAEVKKGKTFTCAIPIDHTGPVFPGRASNVRLMSILNLVARELGLPSDALVNDDMINMPLQGSTQWDSLAHVGYDGCFYNGVEAKNVTAHAGAARNSISSLAESLSTRGVLLDLVRFKWAEAKGHLDPGYAITAADLDACAKAANIKVESGNALLFRPASVTPSHHHPPPPPSHSHAP